MLVSKELRDRGFSYYAAANEYRKFAFSVRYMRGKYYLTQYLGNDTMNLCFDNAIADLLATIDYLMM